MEYTPILISIIVFGAFGFLMFWLGNKQGISEGRRQVLEEDIKREDIKILQTSENLKILNLYESTTQADIIKDVREVNPQLQIAN